MTTVQVGIRFPADVKAWLEKQARMNRSSQNSEVVRSVRERMVATGAVVGAETPAAVTARKDHQEGHDHAAE